MTGRVAKSPVEVTKSGDALVKNGNQVAKCPIKPRNADMRS